MHDPIPLDDQVEGAKVVCWSGGGAHVPPRTRVSTINKINPRTLRVAQEPELFPRDDCERRGAGRVPESRYVTLASSPTGRAQIDAMKNRNADVRIGKAFEAWRLAAQGRSHDDPRECLEALEHLIRAARSAPKYGGKTS